MSRTRRKSRNYEATTDYWQRSQQPLQSLLFLLPMLLLYQWGVIVYRAEVQSYPLVAVNWLEQFLQVFGIGRFYMPPIIVGILLLSWHVVRRDRWFIEWKLYGVMLIETVILALPLYVIALILIRNVEAAAAGGTIDALNWQPELVLKTGAGIYEELLFRLIGIALAHTILVDVLALPQKWGAIGAIVLSAAAFSAVHFLSDDRTLTAGMFLYFAVAGLYFAAVYLIRGFGIVAGTHVMFNIFTILQDQL